VGRSGKRAIFYQTMNERIGRKEVERMFAQAASNLRREHQHLSALDSVAGDGDHGTTMLLVSEQLERSAKHVSPKSLQTLIHDTGLNILGVDGGASSAILGIFILGMADTTMGNDSMDCQELAEAFSAGLRAVSRQSKAQPGDKTMMDALVPAINALRQAASAGRPIGDALEEAASAARTGAESTKDLVARFGRARLQGEKTLGHADPGATSIALLFSGFSSALVKGSVVYGRP
jgi:phosphoenolpyruvate---glycerone phosphotransferase subunit DhaL